MKSGIYAVIVLIVILITHQSLAANYYVDFNTGSDQNSGASEKKAWKSINKVNSGIFQAGDHIYFKAGSTWREQLNISASGSSTSPITFSVFGGNDPAVITGSNILKSFDQLSSAVWKTRTEQPRAVFFDGIRGVKKNSRSELKNEKDWCYSDGYLYIMSFNPSNAYSVIEASVRSNAISINGRNIVVKGFRVQRTLNDAIHISAKSENVIIDDIDALQ